MYDVQNMDIENNQEFVDAIYRAVQTAGERWDSKDFYRLDEETIGDMRSCFADTIRDYRNEYKEIVSRKQRNDIEQQRNGIRLRLDKQIAEEKQTIERFERIIAFCEECIAEGMSDEFYDMRDGSGETFKEKKENLEGVIPARKGLLNKLEEERRMRIDELDMVKEPVVTDKLMMLNLIKLI